MQYLQVLLDDILCTCWVQNGPAGIQAPVMALHTRPRILNKTRLSPIRLSCTTEEELTDWGRLYFIFYHEGEISSTTSTRDYCLNKWLIISSISRHIT